MKITIDTKALAPETIVALVQDLEKYGPGQLAAMYALVAEYETTTGNEFPWDKVEGE